MSLLDLLKGNYEYHVAWTPLRPQASKWYQEQYQQTAAGIPVNPESALNSSAAMACTRAISETLASLPAVVHEQIDLDQKRKARENPMWALLHDQPNREMDSMSWYQLNANRVINRGNSVNIIEYNGRGLPIALWPVHNSRFEIFRNKSPMTAAGRFVRGDIFYRVWPDESDRYFDVPPEDVLNIVSWDTDNGLIGRGVITRAKQEIALDIAQQEYSASMFKNGALPMGLVKHPWIDDPTDRDNFRADINKVHSGRENWNKVGILWDKDADWIKLGFSPSDVQAIESRVFSAKSLCRSYNVPPAIVQIFEDYKFATVEAMLKHFIMLTIRPYAIRFERAIRTQILQNIEDADLFLEFALEGLLRGDPEKQAAMNTMYRSWGILSADEIRQRDLGMNPLEGGLGAVRLAPLNHAPLELVATGQNLQKASNGQPPGEDDEEDDGEARMATWDPSFVWTMANCEMAKPEIVTTVTSSADITQKVVVKAMLREVSAIRGRVSHGSAGFLKWCDEYYQKFWCSLVRDLEVSCDRGMACQIATQHCQESQDRLLSACECSDDEFADTINHCVNSWCDRTIDWEGVTDATDDH